MWWSVGASLIEKVPYDDKHWCTVLQSLVQFYSAYMLDNIFGESELSFCLMCSNVCVSEQEMKDRAENSL